MRSGMRMAVLVGAFVWTSSVSAQEVPRGTILVANMNDDSVWLIDAESGTHRATIETHIAPRSRRFPSARC